VNRSTPRGSPAPSGTFDLLARSVTHELRQPLSLIVGYAELLERGSVGEAERAALVAEIRSAAARLAGSLSRLERADASRRRRFGPDPEREVLDLRA
jgi:signal transduction histidine kinase